MARPGVTYHDVANAALEIQGQGKYPTVENVRACLGTGSSSTIGPHLRDWRMQQDGTSQLAVKENIPAELVSLVKGLWERVVHLGDEKIKIIEDTCEQTVKQLQAETEQRQLDLKNLQGQHHQLQQEKLLLTGEKAHLEEEMRALKEECASLLSGKETLAKQLEENQARIDELHRLHQQVQANLEHYREAVREQRLLDQRQFEQREQQLEQQGKALQTAVKQAEQKLALLEQQHTHVTQEKLQLKELNESLNQQIEKIKIHLLETEKKQAESAHLLQLTKEQYQGEQEKSAKQLESLIQLKAEAGMLTQKLLAAESQNKALTEQQTALAHEKWLLLQEKAQLEGQLTQLNKILTGSRSVAASEN